MERVREAPLNVQQPYEGIPKFLLCIPTDKYRVSCCCGLFTLRAAIYIFAILDIIIGAFSLLGFLAYMDAYPGPEGHFWQMVLLGVDALISLPAILAIHGAAKTNAKKVSYYYYGKIFQMLLKPIPQIIIYKQSCRTRYCTGGDSIGQAIVTGLMLSIYLYEAHVFYSYVNYVAKGETILANNGKDVVQAMEQYRHQAAALELQPYPAIVVGAPLASPGAQVQIGEVVGAESKQTPPQ